jgi:hypothetical protein
LEENHNRYISSTYIQKISQAVGDIACKREQWKYQPPVEKEEVSTIGISLDGTCMLLREEGWRQAMVGSISFYDKHGDQLNSIYVANPPIASAATPHQINFLNFRSLSCFTSVPLGGLLN